MGKEGLDHWSGMITYSFRSDSATHTHVSSTYGIFTGSLISHHNVLLSLRLAALYLLKTVILPLPRRVISVGTGDATDLQMK